MGIMENDRIVSVNGHTFADIGLEGARAVLGTAGLQMDMRVQREVLVRPEPGFARITKIFRHVCPWNCPPGTMRCRRNTWKLL